MPKHWPQGAEASAAVQEQRLACLEAMELPILGTLQDRLDAVTAQQVRRAA